MTKAVGPSLCVGRTILELPRIWINGGSKGFLVGMDPGDLGRVVEIKEVEVGIAG